MSRGAASPLPRIALWLFSAAYVLPGVIGRDPWKNADVAAFGQMLSLAEGRSPWLAPALGGEPTGAAVLPLWLGAAVIRAGGPWLDPALAARLPFALLLALTLLAVWYACYHLARTDAAQPLPFAFGGGAEVVDYARALADAAVLALIATLGLLQLGHETTPELAQLAAVAVVQWGLAAAPFRPRGARAALLLGLPALSASGAPAMALALGLAGTLICARSSYAQVRPFAAWTAAATLLGALCAAGLHAWSWRAVELLGLPASLAQWPRLLLWFLWPAWALAAWTLWRWRAHLSHRHLSVPLASVGVALVASLAMGGSDRALMLGLPGIAVLAAFALPTLQRGTSSAIDWFSVFMFTGIAAFIWFMYIAMQTGVPAKPAANIARLAPGFVPRFSLPALVFALLGTLAWAWLVRWRTRKHREALWKSLVLPAGGVALAWLLLMTLWLPLLDYARSYRPLVSRLGSEIARHECLAAPGLPLALIAALEAHGRWTVRRGEAAAAGRCPVLLQIGSQRERPATPPGWSEVARFRRPTDSEEVIFVYRRPAGSLSPAAPPTR